MMLVDPGGGYQNRLQYADGSTEWVDVPVQFSIGTVVAVVHKKDGSVIVTLAE